MDSRAGNDSASGTSPDQAWRSLDQVNRTTFRPGDRILLKAGGSWQGQLWPKGSGEEHRPIVIGDYGKGPKPRIQGEGRVDDADNGGRDYIGTRLYQGAPDTGAVEYRT
ncbi:MULTISPECIES: hypothetical protein [unclassified Streptomyces]|uniref:hypothetical protein n=1 Tax=unclassified Streptomyces TaxID=2593676 RepID=UPI003369E4AB